MATQPTEPSYEPATQNESHLWDYLHVVLRRRQLVLAVFPPSSPSPPCGRCSRKPVYEATAQLLIETQNPNVLTFKDVTEERPARHDDYYQTQYKLLQSRSLARRSSSDLNLLNDPEFGGPRAGADRADASAQPPARAPVEGAISGLPGAPARPARPQQPPRERAASSSGARPRRRAIANRLAQLYIQQTLDLRFETSAEAGAVAGRRRSRSSARRWRRPTGSSRRSRRQEGIVNIEERRTLLDQRLKELGTALNETEDRAAAEGGALPPDARARPTPRSCPR